MKTSEWGRLALTGLGAGPLGAALGLFLVEPREAPHSTANVVDMGPLEVAIRELKDMLVQASVRTAEWQPEIPKRHREQVIGDAHLMRVPVLPAPDNAALDARLGRFVGALEGAVERLEKLAGDEHRSARRVENGRGHGSSTACCTPLERGGAAGEPPSAGRAGTRLPDAG